MVKSGGASLVGVMIALGLGMIGAFIFFKHQGETFRQIVQANEVVRLTSYTQSLLALHSLQPISLKEGCEAKISGKRYTLHFDWEKREEQERKRIRAITYIFQEREVIRFEFSSGYEQ